MKTWKSPLAIAWIALFLTGCGDSLENAFNDSLSLQQEMLDICAEAKDEASAQAAARKLDALQPKAQAISDRIQKLTENMTMAEKIEAFASTEKTSRARLDSMTQFAIELQRVQSDPALSKQLLPVMTKLNATPSKGFFQK